jgi:hypothetical protein
MTEGALVEGAAAVSGRLGSMCLDLDLESGERPMESRGTEPGVSTRTVLTHEEARRFYDRFGALQDWQCFFEDPAIRAMVTFARFPSALSVVEFGCGTGWLAEELLDHHLQPTATYRTVTASRRRWSGSWRASPPGCPPRLLRRRSASGRWRWRSLR